MEIHYAALTRSVRKTLESGSPICVVGWTPSYHSEFTRELSRKKVIFLDSSSKDIPQSAGLVIFMKFTRHSYLKRAKSKKSVYPGIVNFGEMKAILGLCEDLLLVGTK